MAFSFLELSYSGLQSISLVDTYVTENLISEVPEAAIVDAVGVLDTNVCFSGVVDDMMPISPATTI